jgi:type IV pilus assembly protein PilZ
MVIELCSGHRGTKLEMESILLEYYDSADLYDSYMPFFKQGGLFFRTDDEYDLGTKFNLHVSLPDSIESISVLAQVSWITPKNAQNGKDAGIGVMFVEDHENLNQQIEHAINIMVASGKPTLSM